MATCKPFKGPITPVGLIQWLVSCEDAFKLAAHIGRRPLPDDLKIISAGSVISAEAERLFEWWTSREEDLKQLSWDEFVDSMTSWILGLGWKTKALESFSRTEQGDSTVEQYTTRLRAAHLVLKRADVEISDFHYKCQLLFHASPIISTLVQTTPNFDFSGVTIKALEERMRVVANEADGEKGKQPEASGSSGSTSDNPPPYAGTGGGQWELSEQWGHESSSNVPFTNMNLLPQRPEKFGRVISVSLSGDSYLKGLKTLIRSDETHATWNLDTHTVSYPTFQDMTLDAGDYVNCVVFTRPANDCIGSARIETSRGKSLTAGTVRDADTKLFRAKRGQQIVGFHGTFGTGSSHFYKVGVIYAPLLPGQKET